MNHSWWRRWLTSQIIIIAIEYHTNKYGWNENISERNTEVSNFVLHLEGNGYLKNANNQQCHYEV